MSRRSTWRNCSNEKVHPSDNAPAGRASALRAGEERNQEEAHHRPGRGVLPSAGFRHGRLSGQCEPPEGGQDQRLLDRGRPWGRVPRAWLLQPYPRCQYLSPASYLWIFHHAFRDDDEHFPEPGNGVGLPAQLRRLSVQAGREGRRNDRPAQEHRRRR